MFLTAECECFIWTDLHFRTFDHVIYTHNVGCEYTLLRGDPSGSNFESFDLIGRFDFEPFSLINVLRLVVDCTAYEILRNGSLLMNGVYKTTLYRDDKISYTYLPGESMVRYDTFYFNHFQYRPILLTAFHSPSQKQKKKSDIKMMPNICKYYSTIVTTQRKHKINYLTSSSRFYCISMGKRALLAEPQTFIRQNHCYLHLLRSYTRNSMIAFKITN